MIHYFLWYFTGRHWTDSVFVWTCILLLFIFSYQSLLNKAYYYYYYYYYYYITRVWWIFDEFCCSNVSRDALMLSSKPQRTCANKQHLTKPQLNIWLIKRLFSIVTPIEISAVIAVLNYCTSHVKFDQQFQYGDFIDWCQVKVQLTRDVSSTVASITSRLRVRVRQLRARVQVRVRVQYPQNGISITPSFYVRCHSTIT